jgi:hypothetical protein
MKSTGDNKNENRRYHQENMANMNFRLRNYDNTHENFVVPWQMGVKQKKDYNF